jgi:hypothetical protein
LMKRMSRLRPMFIPEAEAMLSLKGEEGGR